MTRVTGMTAVTRMTGAQGSKFKFEFGSTCATRCKFLGALPKF